MHPRCPVIHAQVGDTILVHFENLDTAFNRPHSIHFHGVHYSPGSDGASGNIVRG